MRHARPNPALAAGLAIGLACAMADAQAADTQNELKIGYAYIGFNAKSGDLAGPAGTTPPGVQASLDDASTVGIVYERTVSGPWAVVLQVGAPPLIKMNGAGNGAALGEVGTARAWFPAVLAQYTFGGPGGMQPFVAAGVNYTFYTDGHIEPAYTAAFGGSSSTSKLGSSWGYVVKVGVGFPLSRDWTLDASYSRYGIDTKATITTATPGFGDIARTIDVKADPGVIGLTLGYRF